MGRGEGEMNAGNTSGSEVVDVGYLCFGIFGGM